MVYQQEMPSEKEKGNKEYKRVAGFFRIFNSFNRRKRGRLQIAKVRKAFFISG